MEKEDKILVNLLRRVSILEEEISELKEKIYQKDEMSETIDKNLNPMERKKIPKSLTIETIQEKLNDIKIIKRPNKEGGGLLLKYKDGSTKTVLLKHSRNYIDSNNGVKDSEFDFKTWYTLEVENNEFPFDYYIFSLENRKGALDFLVFSNYDLRNILSKKELEKNSKYHFYFSKKLNGRVIEDRGEGIDIHKFFNNWKVIKNNEKFSK